ncbi:sensor histidine kinase [Agromyces arachidis]|uniref:sensor histidine kinase n=1 Tax=Agromyces arachidis TaxID=766966 RepID=UPI0040576623
MTLGLPEHLARESLSRAITLAGHSAAGVCLIAGMAIAAASVVDGRAWGVPDPRVSAALVLALIAVQAVAQVALMRWPSVTITVVVLVVGAGVAFGVTAVVMLPGSDFESTNNVIVALPRIALILLGGAGIGSRIAITWAALAWGMGEAASLLAVALEPGGPAAADWVPNASAATALVIVVAARTFDGISRRSAARGEAGLHRASQQARELAIRHDYELRAIARLHDTALSHLVAVAAAGSGPVPERLRTGIRHDLALIVGRDWAIDHAGDPESDPLGRDDRAGTPHPGGPPPEDDAAPFVDAFAVAEQAGVTVRLSGDAGAVDVLDASRRDALEAAVAQCLVNVVRHAGVHEAEVAIGPADGELTVAVVDGGAGFDPALVPPDRIGLRTSIRGRIEQVGGRVDVWSRPGVGTTVLISVPTGGDA